ncbi:phosphotransferase family protein [Rhodococcus globerulus]|uniref:phosphotransferase family protein n=1 Tax=Rhodococcus globerulus TaxID=33008 RepID=UPI003019CC72
MTIPTDSMSLSPEIINWVEETIRGQVVSRERRPGGGRREAWYIDVEVDGETLPLFLRYDRATPEEKGDPFTLHREARIFAALADSAVPIPRTVGVHPTEQAILSTRVPGYPWFSRMQSEDERVSVATDFMQILAAMHQIDPRLLKLDDQHADMDLRELVDLEINIWEKIYRDVEAPADPLIEVALEWVRKNRPDIDGPVVIVQGDTGPGNFLYQDGKVTAVLDLEMGHLGDPHDDLAWVSLRAVQEPFTNFADRLQDYAALVPWTVETDRIRYYRVLAELRVVILGHRSTSNPDLLSEVGNSLIYGLLHRRLLTEALSDVLGIPLPDISIPEPKPGPMDWLYGAALEQIRQIIVPRSEDPFVIQRSKGLARILKVLQQFEHHNGNLEELDLAELNEILGTTYTSSHEASSELCRRVRAGQLSEITVVSALARSVGRRAEMLRSASGVLADRHFDPLPADLPAAK